MRLASAWRSPWPIRILLCGVVAAALPYLAVPVYRFPPPAPFSGPALFNPYEGLRGPWSRASLHAHSGLDARQPDEDVVRAYRQMGYGVVAVAPHQRISASGDLRVYEHGYGWFKQHQLVLGAQAVDWFEVPFWQGRNEKQYVLNRLAGSAGLVAIAHPMDESAYSVEDLGALTNYALIEVMNGTTAHDVSWDAALSSGRPVWGIAVDDTHDVTDRASTRVAWTMVHAPGGVERVLDALAGGRSYGVAASGEADIALDTVTVRGQTLEVTASGPATFRFVGTGGKTLKVVQSAASASYDVPSSEPYVRTVIETGGSRLYLNPVIRYDGTALSVPQASVDAVWTFVRAGGLISALVATCTAVFLKRKRK